MHDLLEACVQLEHLAVDLYARFIDDASDSELRDVFRTLRAEEAEHLIWWSDVRRRFDEGLIAEVEFDDHVTAYMRAIVATLRAMLESSATAEFSDDDRLALASSLEFFALDPVFAALIRESDLELGGQRLKAYRSHIELLLATMERRASWPLAPHIALLRAANVTESETAERELHDAVTGLPMRAVAVHAIDNLCSDATRDAEAISLALVDVDLAPVRGLGRGAVERTQVRLASVLTSLLRFTDLLVRADGPGRFAVVFPGTASATACTLTASLGEAAAGAVAEELGGSRAAEVRSATVTLVPGTGRCGGELAFTAAEELLQRAAEADGPSAICELV